MAKMRRYSTSDAINRIVKGLIKNDWTLVRCNRHPRLQSPDGRTTLTVPMTPSDHRAEKNWIHQLRRQGVEVTA